MKLNINKSSVMWFMNVSGPAIFVDGNQLQEVDHQIYLGIIFDKKLKWDFQINDVCKLCITLHLYKQVKLLVYRKCKIVPFVSPSHCINMTMLLYTVDN